MNKLRRSAAFIIVAILALGAVACGGSSKNTPDGVAKAYWEAVFKGDAKAVREYTAGGKELTEKNGEPDESGEESVDAKVKVESKKEVAEADHADIIAYYIMSFGNEEIATEVSSKITSIYSVTLSVSASGEETGEITTYVGKIDGDWKFLYPDFGI